MLHAKGVGILRVDAETVDKHVGIAVGYLQADAQQEREDEEHSHLALAEQAECLQAKGVGKRLLLLAALHRTYRKREGIAKEDDAEDAGSQELVLVILEAHEVDEEHHQDEAYGAEDADGREILHGVHACLRQRIERYRVGQRNSRHEEGHAEGIEREQGSELGVGPIRVAVPGSGYHKQSGQQMADAQHFLGLHPAVGNNTDERRHKDADETLNGIEPPDIVAKSKV